MVTLKAGDPAPEFDAEDQNGRIHTLGDYKGRGLFVFFYPKANTSG